MHDFDWDDVRVFLAIVEHGSLSEAAARLGINQSTVSRRIRGLESKLGVSLFERKRGSRWIVTSAGEDMLRSAEQMNDYANAITRDVLSSNTEIRGHVTVTFAEVGSRNISAPLFADLARQHPELSLTLVVDSNVLDLTAREADVAIRVTDAVPEDSVAKPICTPSIGVYATEEMRARYRAGEKALPLMGWTGDHKYTQWLQTLMPEARLMYEASSAILIADMAMQGVCIASMPCFEGECLEELVRFDEFPVFSGPSLWVVSHSDLRSTARVRLVRDRLVDELTALKDQIELPGADSVDPRMAV